MVVRVPTVHPLVAGWLGATAPLPSSTAGAGPRIASLGEKSQIQNSKYGFYWIGIAFTPSKSQKILSRPVGSRDCLCWIFDQPFILNLSFSCTKLSCNISLKISTSFIFRDQRLLSSELPRLECLLLFVQFFFFCLNFNITSSFHIVNWRP